MSPVPIDATHGVIVPSYNSGLLLRPTVESLLRAWRPIIVVIDGSTDGSDRSLEGMEEDLHVLRLERNGGKGAAVLAALEIASKLGWTHAAVVDADGQHAVEDLERFMGVSKRRPDAMVLGVPVFGPDAPWERVWGRKIANGWTQVETLWGGIQDSLFGFRVYPVGAALRILRSISGGRAFDFDTQLVVRLYWEGVVPINLPTAVRYRVGAGGDRGVSHFRYVRDNLLLLRAHLQLVLGAIRLLPHLLRLRWRAGLRGES
ncbi:MAG: hypothetical protein RLZZ244_1152 [Verrucomicrobiota bacterium]|jgi:glycosyltransferase involved in cell wall biosynthesis